MTNKLEMYATSFCRHCMDARDFLASKDIEYDEYLLDLMPKEKDVMLERCGQKSLPQIFINNQHIGGLSDLRELDNQGKLNDLLSK